MSTEQAYPPIGDHALLADCHSAALVTSHGTIDWACIGRFDAPTVFASLLDAETGGHLRIRAVDLQETSRRYVPGTLVLETDLTTSTGTLRLRDAFAMHEGGSQDPHQQLVRGLEVIEGTVEVEVDVSPRFDYGALQPWMRTAGDGLWVAVGGETAVVITSDVDLQLDREQDVLGARVRLEEGEQRWLAVTGQEPHRIDPDSCTVDRLPQHMDETVRWWQQWSDATVVPDDCREQVRHSAAVLKGLTCAPTGAIVAAATTSLPETMGGERNWDYRYCWVRDSTLVLDALARAGHPEVAGGFRDFIMRSAAGQADDLQIMYGVYGARRLPEIELDLAGYRGSRPVRIGNAAAEQSQLDVYGHVLDGAHLWHTEHDSMDDDEWHFLTQVADAACDHWQDPDHGLWEIRGEPQHFVESKVMCWVALDRAVRLVDNGAGDGDVDRWGRERDAIRAAVLDRGLDPDGGHLVQAFDSTQLDASLLRLPMTGFIAPRDPVMVATVQAVRDHLEVAPHGFVRRYSNDTGTDGLEGEEGAFLLCSFWLVEALALQGDVEEATTLFQRLLEVSNDVGLFAEEVDPTDGSLLGNFPQAFTHLGLIRSAFALADARAA